MDNHPATQLGNLPAISGWSAITAVPLGMAPSIIVDAFDDSRATQLLVYAYASAYAKATRASQFSLREAAAYGFGQWIQAPYITNSAHDYFASIAVTGKQQIRLNLPALTATPGAFALAIMSSNMRVKPAIVLTSVNFLQQMGSYTRAADLILDYVVDCSIDHDFENLEQIVDDIATPIAAAPHAHLDDRIMARALNVLSFSRRFLMNSAAHTRLQGAYDMLVNCRRDQKSLPVHKDK